MHRSPAQRRRGFKPCAERLEDRCVLSTYRTIDGTMNNLANPEWGSTDEQLIRIAPAAYGDGISTLAGATRPGPRVISNEIVAHEEEEALNDRHLSNYSYVWGQFLDHDLDLTQPPATGRESAPILVPADDEFFLPGSEIPFTRSRFDPATGTTTPRQQINQITAWIDGSQVYGSDAATAASLRTFVGGKLKTSAGNLLPTDEAGFFLAGDVRANENIELTSMHTLFVREHNRLADLIYPTLTGSPSERDEMAYQMARAIVGAELQVITYKEWLPSLIGPNALRPYTGYNPGVNPGIANEFSTALFRLHTLINNDIEFFGDDGREVHEGIELRDGFFNPDLIREIGIDSIVKYVASATAEEVDNQIVDGLRNFLFDPPGMLDLASLNIQRGRDHGLADYNTVRAAYGLPRVRNFAQISSNPEVRRALRELYGNVNNIDVWVGALAEDHVPGSSFGPLIQRALIDQFERLRDGDRFWYQRVFSGEQLAELEQTTLADIIKRNTTITNLQDNVFFMRAEARGVVFYDFNGNGEQDGFDFGLPGIRVELLNDEGEVIASTRTGLTGRYSFDEMTETGDFQVRVAVPPLLRLTTENPMEFLISRGDVTITGLDFGLRLGLGGGGGGGGGEGAPPPGSPGSDNQGSDEDGVGFPLTLSVLLPDADGLGSAARLLGPGEEPAPVTPPAGGSEEGSAPVAPNASGQLPASNEPAFPVTPGNLPGTGESSEGSDDGSWPDRFGNSIGSADELFGGV
jgi:hypothetical protein